MAAPVITTSGAWTSLYTVPSGKVFILRRCTVVNLSGGAMNFILGMNSSLQWLLLNAMANSTSADIDTWLVYEAGDVVSCYNDHGTIEVSVHGQLLSSP